MTATAAQIAQLRRMVNEPTTTIYSDDAIQTAIESHPLMDVNGTDPTYLDYATTPPTITADPDWIPTYDLNAAAADIWDEKAAALAAKFDFSADGGNYSRSQGYEMAQKMALHYRARRAIGNHELIKKPIESTYNDTRVN